MVPREQIFLKYWTHSDKMCSHCRPGKPVHANGREVTTKDISGVHRGMSRKLNDCNVYINVPQLALHSIRKNLRKCTRKLIQRAVPPGTRLVHYTAALSRVRACNPVRAKLLNRTINRTLLTCTLSNIKRSLRSACYYF